MCQEIVKALAEHGDELFQLTVTFGNFDTYEQAVAFMRYLLSTEGRVIESAMSIRGSYGKPNSQHT